MAFYNTILISHENSNMPSLTLYTLGQPHFYYCFFSNLTGMMRRYTRTQHYHIIAIRRVGFHYWIDYLQSGHSTYTQKSIIAPEIAEEYRFP